MQFSLATELSKYGPRVRQSSRPSREAASEYCRRLARGHYENFTVASWLLPRPLLPHFYAIYAYCRWADDLADETHDPAESLELLDWWQHQLEGCYAGEPQHPVFVALEHTIREFSIPREPFERLLVAFRQDQRVTRYETHAEVLDYCAGSANPVGELVLYLGRAHNDHTVWLSDSICTGLQLANFCQDVARDWQRGRVYLPQATLRAAGCGEDDFGAGRASETFRAALCAEVERAEGYLLSGEPLVDEVSRELKLEVALFVAGGLSILRAIRGQRFDVWSQRPTVTRTQKLRLFWQCWRRTRRMSAAGPAR